MDRHWYIVRYKVASNSSLLIEFKVIEGLECAEEKIECITRNRLSSGSIIVIQTFGDASRPWIVFEDWFFPSIIAKLLQWNIVESLQSSCFRLCVCWEGHCNPSHLVLSVLEEWDVSTVWWVAQNLQQEHWSDFRFAVMFSVSHIFSGDNIGPLRVLIEPEVLEKILAPPDGRK